MIKQLIEDLTFDKITLLQGLTRAKIIAYKINNKDFKEWLLLEIGGYKNSELPSYRIVSCDVFAELFLPFRGTRTIPLDVTNVEDLSGKYSFYKLRVTQSIGTLEAGLDEDGKNQYGYEYFSMELTNMLKKMTEEGDNITAIKRRIQLSEIIHILEQTKQRLLDTLLELNEHFPNLENDFKDNAGNNEKVQNIITQNIYGNHPNSNFGIGDHIHQSIVHQNNLDDLIKDLKKLGVEENDVNELKVILENKEENNIGKKVLTWLGNLSTKAIEKGIESQIPLIIEKLHHLI